MKLNYIEDWKHAVEIDNLLRSSNIQDKTKIKNELYLYRMCVPLEKAELNENQLSLFDMLKVCGGEIPASNGNHLTMPRTTSMMPYCPSEALTVWIRTLQHQRTRRTSQCVL